MESQTYVKQWWAPYMINVDKYEKTCFQPLNVFSLKDNWLLNATELFTLK